jgi:hypothetical protein
MHHGKMNSNRIREISVEMCRLLNEQSRLLNSETNLTEMSGDELNGYSRRNERLTELAKELREVV